MQINLSAQWKWSFREVAGLNGRELAGDSAFGERGPSVRADLSSFGR